MARRSNQTKPLILIPAYQPGDALAAATQALIKDGYTLIVVDDGSGPNYRAQFDKLDASIHQLRHDENQGKGAALKTGLRYIRDTFTNYVVITADADGQHQKTDIEKLATKYHQFAGTLLLGVRQFDGKNVPLRSKIGNIATRWIFRILTGEKVSDTQTGLRAFDNSLIDAMLLVPGERFEYEMNVLLACSRQAITINQIPIKTIYENNNETSHFNPIKDSIAVYFELFKFLFSSALSFTIDYLLFVLLIHATSSWALAASVTVSNIVARLGSSGVNFSINKRFVFKHKGGIKKGIMRYGELAIALLIVGTLIVNALTSWLHMPPYLAKLITEGGLSIVSYIIQKRFIFT